MQVEYNDTGHGFPLVLLHGFCESKEVWTYNEQALARHFRVICPDLPGFGETRLEATDVSMEYFAQCIKEFLDALNIRQCVMVGHSLGGYVALAFAEQNPDYLYGLGLVHSTAFADSEERKTNRNKTIQFIQKYGVPQFAESFVPALFSLKNKELYKKEISEVVANASAASEHGVIETTKAMRDRIERVFVVKEFHRPILFIAGKNDATLPLDRFEEQCNLAKDGKLYILEGAGHMGMIEKSAETSEIIGNFVRYCCK